MTPLELFGAPQSVFVWATRMALEEKGAPYRLNAAMPHSDAILAINPFGKIPAMRHGTLVLFESLAIVHYADRTFEGPALIPGDAIAAGRVMQWSCAVATSVFPQVVEYMQAYAFPKGKDGVPDRVVIDRLIPAMRKMLSILDGVLARTQCLAGDNVTLADMYLMPILSYLTTFPESAEAIAGSPVLTSYVEALQQYPSYVASKPAALLGAAS